MRSDYSVVVFAAGRGTRAGLPVPKVLAPVNGRPLLYHTLRSVAATDPASITVVVGHQGAMVEEVVSSTLEPRW